VRLGEVLLMITKVHLLMLLSLRKSARRRGLPDYCRHREELILCVSQDD
jgi:hypothetical protein